jgi:nitrogen fixation protein NifB
MQCRYCYRPKDLRAERGAEYSSDVLDPEKAVERVAARMGGAEPPRVVELAGTGEPLLNASTYVVLRRLSWLYPGLTLSVWTNGLLLPDRLGELAQSGLRNLTLSLHAATPETAGRIYEWAIYRARKYTGREAAELVLQQQWNGLSNAVEAGLSVTAYVMSIPGVNEHEVPFIRTRAEEIGADRVAVYPYR